MKAKLTLAGMVLVGAACVAQGELVLEYKFDTGSGETAVDTSGNGHDGALENGATWTTGVSGSAVSLDGIDDFVTLPIGTFEGMSDEISISAWVFGGPPLGTEDSVWFYGTSSEDGLSGRQLQVHLPWNNGNVYWRAPGGQINELVSEELYKGQWNHWVFTKKADTGLIQMFANTELIDSGTGSTGTFNAVGASLGNDPSNPDRVYEGFVDEFKIFDHELTTAEIAALYAESFEYRLTDFNQDTKVNLADYDIMAGNFLAAGDNSQGDATLDNFIDLEDFVTWRADFEDPEIPASSLAGSAVPEPSSLLLGLLLAGMLVATRTARP